MARPVTPQGLARTGSALSVVAAPRHAAAPSDRTPPLLRKAALEKEALHEARGADSALKPFYLEGIAPQPPATDEMNGKSSEPRTKLQKTTNTMRTTKREP